MYSSEFAQVSFLSMSNSELFLVKEDEESIEFDILKIPTLEFQDECLAAAASHEPRLHQEQEDKKEEYKCEIMTVSCEKHEKPTLGEFKVEDEDDGFKTPTSSDHKIPLIQQCPPAPIKPKPLPSTKRKVSPNARRSLLLDLSQEVESMFPRPVLADLHRKIKKARREDIE